MIEFYEEDKYFTKERAEKYNKILNDLLDEESLSRSLNMVLKRDSVWKIRPGGIFLHFFTEEQIIPRVSYQIIALLALNDSEIEKGLPPRIFGNLEIYIDSKFAPEASHQIHFGEISCSERGKWEITLDKDGSLYSEDEDEED